LREYFGDIDIYLFDQLLRGRIVPGMRIFDAGCGGGRNIQYLLREGYDVSGIDIDERSVQSVRRMARQVAPSASGITDNHFRVEPVEATSFPDVFADLVISHSVLHFARDEQHFQAMMREMWRLLKPGGLFFSRLASTIGIEKEVEHLSGRRFLIPDGTGRYLADGTPVRAERYLVDEEILAKLTESLGARMIDPLKTTVVERRRAMTTWVLEKGK
jgi:tellurite methyltransferase